MYNGLVIVLCRMRMFGLVVWLFMWCWLEGIHLKTLMIQETSGKQSKYIIYNLHKLIFNCFSGNVSVLMVFVKNVVQRIMAVQYKIPDYVHISQECKHLLSRIFVTNPAKVRTFIFSWVKTVSLVFFDFVIFFLCRESRLKRSRSTRGSWRTYQRSLRILLKQRTTRETTQASLFKAWRT